jgi:uncharacterized iron-regulated protein
MHLALSESAIMTPQQGNISANRVKLNTWFDVRRHEAGRDVIAKLVERDVVLLGETHNNAEHHRWQLKTLSELCARRRDIIVGFEMFPRRVQVTLDRWSKGELTEAALLREVDWQQIWDFDAQLYLPLFNFARMNQLPMMALNVDRETNRRVAAGAAGDEVREGVGEPAPASAAYRTRLLQWFQRHPMGPTNALDMPRFERFVRAQLFWDRAMAEAIARGRSQGQLLTVAIIGSGHIEYGDGVPWQLAALGIPNVGTALPWPADAICPVSEPLVADFVFGVASAEADV